MSNTIKEPWTFDKLIKTKEYENLIIRCVFEDPTLKELADMYGVAISEIHDWKQIFIDDIEFHQEFRSIEKRIKNGEIISKYERYFYLINQRLYNGIEERYLLGKTKENENE